MRKFAISILLIMSTFLSVGQIVCSATVSFDKCLKVGYKSYVTKPVESPEFWTITAFMQTINDIYKENNKISLALSPDKLSRIVFIPDGENTFEMYKNHDISKLEEIDDYLYVRMDFNGNYAIVVNAKKVSDRNTIKILINTIQKVIKSYKKLSCTLNSKNTISTF